MLLRSLVTMVCVEQFAVWKSFVALNSFSGVVMEDARLNCLMLTGKRDLETLIVDIYISEHHSSWFFK
jgi:hypothetical protein